MATKYFCFVFKLLLGVILISFSQQNMLSTDEVSNILDTTLPENSKRYCTLDNYDSCTITCGFCTSIELSKSIYSIIRGVPACTYSVKLKIVGIKFVDKCLRLGVFPSIDNIVELTIEKSDITDIEPGAFDRPEWKNLAKLHLKNLPVSHLKNGIFRGLSNVWYLIITNLALEKIDENILEPLVKMTTLEFVENKLPLNINNLTGTSKMTRLQIVELRFNNFCRSLTNKTFSGIPNVQSLYLSESLIRSIGPGTFDPIAKNLLQIHLNNNLIKTLPADIFQHFRMDLSVKIYLDSNPWECDCNLIGLKNTIERNPRNFLNPVICKSPEIYESFNILTVPLKACTDPSEDKTSIIKKCEHRSDDESLYQNFERKQSSRKGNSIQIDGQFMQITGNYKDGINVEVNFSSSDYASIWFDDESCFFTYFEEEDGENCIEDYNKTEQVTNLTVDSSYIFCLVKKSSNTISPFNCIPYYISKETSEEPGTNDDDHYYIAVIIFIVLLVFAIFFGIFFGICLTRRYPSFIRSSSSSKILIQQISHNEIWKRNDPPTRIPRSKPQLNRRLSDTSVASSQSYITTVSPSPFDFVSWKMDRQKTTTHEKENIYIDQFQCDASPPPLPPHPHRRHNNTYQNTMQSDRGECSKQKRKSPNRL